MLYEPSKTKQYIIIFGAVAAVLAVLAVVVIPLVYKNKTSQNPTVNLPLVPQEQKIQKEFEKLEAMRKSMNLKEPTQEEIQKEFDELEKQKAEADIIQPTPEQIQAEFDKLEQMRK